MLDALAPPDAFENRGLLVLAVRRNQDRDRLADDLLGRIAEIRSAPLFQLVMMPLRSLLMMASSEDSTMEAIRCVAFKDSNVW